MMELVYESLSDSSDNDQDEEEREHSEIIGSEKENNPKTKDYSRHNKSKKKVIKCL